MSKLGLLGLLLWASLAIGQQGDADIDALIKASPSDILRLRRAMDAEQFALHQNLDTSKPIVDSTTVNFDPSEPPIVVNLLMNAPTTVMFRDITGGAWPVRGVKGFDGELFSAQKVENEFKNSVVLHAKLPAGASYLAVYLDGLPQPINIKLVVGSGTYHQSKFIEINEIGPFAEVTPVAMALAAAPGMAADSDLQAVSFGVAPTDSRMLDVDAPATKSWQKGSHIFIRTKLNIFLPNHERILIGPGNFYAYKFNDDARLFTATNEQGRIVHIKVGE